jgi:hypothetical protein
METLRDKKQYNQHNPIKKNTKNTKKDKNVNYSTPIRVYFPNISINKMNDVLNPDVNKAIKATNTNKATKANIIDISKYLVDESNKILIYSSTGIFEMINNSLFQLYPIDKNVKEITINNKLELLLDASYMKRHDTPSYQIPYNHNIKYKTIKTYKNDIKSNIKFIIEMENGSIYDFYMLITSADVTNDENKKIEINKFAKDEALSFLSRLNLYR